MIRKIMMYFLISLCFVMPVISAEGIVPWIVSLIFIHLSFKEFKISNNIKKIAYNTLYCGGIILIYNIVGRYIEKVLVAMWM